MECKVWHDNVVELIFLLSHNTWHFNFSIQKCMYEFIVVFYCSWICHIVCVNVWHCISVCNPVSAVFQRGGQKVSWMALFLLLIGLTFALVILFVAVAKQITWLDYLYYISYIKLAVTLIKYVPQVSCTQRQWGPKHGNTLTE